MIDHGRARYIRLNISSQLEVEVFWGVGGSETQKFETYRSADFPDEVHQLLPYSDFIFTSCTLPWKTFQNFRVPGSNNGTALMYGKKTIYFIKKQFLGHFFKVFVSTEMVGIPSPPERTVSVTGVFEPFPNMCLFRLQIRRRPRRRRKRNSLGKEKNWIWDFLFRGQL